MYWSGVSGRKAAEAHSLSDELFSLSLPVYICSPVPCSQDIFLPVSAALWSSLQPTFFSLHIPPSFLASQAKSQPPSTIARMDSQSIPTTAIHPGPPHSFMAGKHHSMVIVSLYLAIKVIHSLCYAADLFRITPTAHPEANKLSVQREINLP